MLQNKLVITRRNNEVVNIVIDSSVIISCEFSEEVNSDTNLRVGDVTSSELTMEVLSSVDVRQDDQLSYYIIEDGVETLMGVFWVDKPTVSSRTTLKFSAYDKIARTEKVFSDWLLYNQGGFPMPLYELVAEACDYCGVTLITTDFPHYDLMVNAFYGDGITCRQIISWAAAIAGRYVRANEDGDIEFAWYTENDGIIFTPGANSYADGMVVTSDGDGNVSITSDQMTFDYDENGNVTVDIPGVAVVNSNGDVNLISDSSIPYFQNSMSFESYSTDTIQQVRINHSDGDIGIMYPSDATGNCFTISGNMILGACSSEDVAQVASTLYYMLKDISYVPARVRVPRTIKVRAGDIVRLQTPVDTIIKTYVMSISISGNGTSVSSTGDKSYGTNASVSSQRYTNLSGRVMEVTVSEEGLETRNADLEGRVSRLGQTVSGLETSVLQTMQDLNGLREDTATQMTSSIQTAKEMIDTALEEYVTTDEFGTYKSSVSTKFTQTSDEFKMQFDSTKTDINNVNKDLQQKYEERTKYIRFVDGNIVLGSSDSEIILIIKNDKISFVRNVTGLPEVAWFADDVLNVVEGQFTTQLNIGKFGFRPGANGNLSFKKVVS